MAKKRVSVKVTANFEANLEAVKTFLAESDAAFAFDALLDELLGSVIPNLEQFPELGRLFLSRPVHSVEAHGKVQKLKTQIGGGELREYVTGGYVILYTLIDQTVYLLSIKHHRQLSFDFERLWDTSGPQKE
jgi:mRNA-degrading endonuclease RelE of RelBE toxin-antitoxin system